MHLFPRFNDSIDFTRILVLVLIPSAIIQVLNAVYIGNENNKRILISSVIYVSSLSITIIVFGEFSK
jgi:hypothetical protein